MNLHHQHSRFASSFLLLGLCVSLVGCSAGKSKSYGVSGTATFNGNPIPVGRVYFDPDPTKNGTGPQGFADIKDGRYDTAQKGKGIVGGSYIVRVEGFDGQGSERSPLGKPLFVTYTQSVELPAQNEQMDIQVPASAAEGLGTQITVDP
jgi:hypothetical protein